MKKLCISLFLMNSILRAAQLPTVNDAPCQQQQIYHVEDKGGTLFYSNQAGLVESQPDQSESAVQPHLNNAAYYPCMQNQVCYVPYLPQDQQYQAQFDSNGYNAESNFNQSQNAMPGYQNNHHGDAFFYINRNNAQAHRNNAETSQKIEGLEEEIRALRALVSQSRMAQVQRELAAVQQNQAVVVNQPVIVAQEINQVVAPAAQREQVVNQPIVLAKKNNSNQAALNAMRVVNSSPVVRTTIQRQQADRVVAQVANKPSVVAPEISERNKAQICGQFEVASQEIKNLKEEIRVLKALLSQTKIAEVQTDQAVVQQNQAAVSPIRPEAQFWSKLKVTPEQNNSLQEQNLPKAINNIKNSTAVKKEVQGKAAQSKSVEQKPHDNKPVVLKATKKQMVVTKILQRPVSIIESKDPDIVACEQIVDSLSMIGESVVCDQESTEKDDTQVTKDTNNNNAPNSNNKKHKKNKSKNKVTASSNDANDDDILNAAIAKNEIEAQTIKAKQLEIRELAALKKMSEQSQLAEERELVDFMLKGLRDLYLEKNECFKDDFISLIIKLFKIYHPAPEDFTQSIVNKIYEASCVYNYRMCELNSNRCRKKDAIVLFKDSEIVKKLKTIFSGLYEKNQTIVEGDRAEEIIFKIQKFYEAFAISFNVVLNEKVDEAIIKEEMENFAKAQEHFNLLSKPQQIACDFNKIFSRYVTTCNLHKKDINEQDVEEIVKKCLEDNSFQIESQSFIAHQMVAKAFSSYQDNPKMFDHLSGNTDKQVLNSVSLMTESAEELIESISSQYNVNFDENKRHILANLYAILVLDLKKYKK